MNGPEEHINLGSIKIVHDFRVIGVSIISNTLVFFSIINVTESKIEHITIS